MSTNRLTQIDKDVRAAFPTREMRRRVSVVVKYHVASREDRGVVYKLATQLRLAHRCNPQYTPEVAAYEAVEAFAGE